MDEQREIQLIQDLAEIKVSQKYTHEILIKMDHVVFGNGSEGLVRKVDRLEQTEIRRAFHIRAIWAAIIAGTGKIVFGWLK